MTRGQLTISCSPMYAGKRAALLEHPVCAQAQGLRVSFLKPAFYTRSGTYRIPAHDSPSLSVAPVAVLPELRSPEIPCGAQAMPLDEVQFMAAPQIGGDAVDGSACCCRSRLMWSPASAWTGRAPV
ncbi:hypothetical protein EBE87_26740 [Pseudoroseomonas wenyumeiae]|uniref:thymidine kinase n=1 Tax=Teichococcus wenyumeiae TaxID=2478470 RepID=A0A3A9JE68_9PROT|nr:hypothetical protein D6Z83_22465 [Pseudoroseomonas wenyumeiae]RMI15214.1 hypothetical protein EBE87_26740 [Pseudoroseomonas wenyumeiae]